MATPIVALALLLGVYVTYVIYTGIQLRRLLAKRHMRSNQEIIQDCPDAIDPSFFAAAWCEIAEAVNVPPGKLRADDRLEMYAATGGMWRDRSEHIESLLDGKFGYSMTETVAQAVTRLAHAKHNARCVLGPSS